MTKLAMLMMIVEENEFRDMIAQMLQIFALARPLSPADHNLIDSLEFHLSLTQSAINRRTKAIRVGVLGT